MQIGRGPVTKVFRPNSSNTMFERTQAQLEGHARSHGERYSNALNVDGPNMVFWTNRDGAIPCSCRAVNASSIDADITPIFDEGEKPTTTKVVIGTKSTMEGNLREAKVTQVKGNKKALSEFELTPNRLRDLTSIDNIRSTNLDEFIRSGEYEEDDILDALASSENGSGSLVDTNDPFNLFADKIIECPVCLGTGYIDAWQPYNGQRIVLDTSNVYSFFCEECNIDDSVNPTLVSMLSHQTIQWTIKLPLVWDEIIRLNVYNGTNLISPEWYEWSWSVPNMALQGYMEPSSLSALQNIDTNVNLLLYAKEDFPFTHAEIIFMYAPLIRGQVPEVPHAYEDEFDSWQASVGFELPINVDLAEGDYIVEAKYKRVWKVNSINIRKTAGGTIFGISADVRALHRFERIFYQLSVFQTVPYGLLGSKYP